MHKAGAIAGILLLAATPAMSLRVQDGELGSLQAQYRDEQVRARRLRAQATDARAELATLEARAASLARAQNVDDDRVAAQKARLAELTGREAVLIRSLARERDRQGRLLSALQMMSRDPPPPLLIPADKAVDTVRAAILIQAMTPEIERRAEALVAQQAEIGRIRRLAVLSSEQLLVSESAQGDRRAEMETLATRKRALLTVLAADAERSERAARVLESRIRALGGAVGPSPDAVIEAATTRLPGGRTRLSAPVSGEARRDARGGLNWTVNETGVVAPAPGTVAHVGPLSGWGEVVILDLGPGWRAVIAGLDSVSVQEGARVSEGQPLGRAGSGAEVHFELRRDERQVDPRPWLD